MTESLNELGGSRNPSDSWGCRRNTKMSIKVMDESWKRRKVWSGLKFPSRKFQIFIPNYVSVQYTIPYEPTAWAQGRAEGFEFVNGFFDKFTYMVGIVEGTVVPFGLISRCVWKQSTSRNNKGTNQFPRRESSRKNSTESLMKAHNLLTKPPENASETSPDWHDEAPRFPLQISLGFMIYFGR